MVGAGVGCGVGGCGGVVIAAVVGMGRFGDFSDGVVLYSTIIYLAHLDHAALRRCISIS
jgi:hypothetical protein